MRRRLALCAIVLAGCAAEDPVAPPTSPPPGDGAKLPPRVLVVNSLSWTLSTLDPGPGELTTQAAPLGTWANRISYHPGKRVLLVAASGDNAVQFLDPGTYAETKLVDLGPGSNPWHAIPSSVNHSIVSNWLSGEVRRIDHTRGEAGQPLATTAGPEGMAVSGRFAFVACSHYREGPDSYGEGKVEVIDLDRWQVVDTVTVGRNPQDVLVARDGRVHVLCSGTYGQGSNPEEGRVSVLDPDTRTVVATLELGDAPGRFAQSEDGTVWVSGFSGGVRRYDGDTLSPLPDPVDPALTAPGFSGVDCDDETGTVYVTNFESDLLLAVDSTSGTASDVWIVGDGPVDVLVLRED